MLIVLSPAKTLDFESPIEITDHSLPQYVGEAAELIYGLVKLDADQIANLMSISDKLAALNVDRFQRWDRKSPLDNSRQAILAFKGDVYSGLEAQTLSKSDLKYAQDHLRILSGLYGILRPLDFMQPYRLEMGRKFANQRGKNLYEFWGNMLTENLNEILQSEKVLINLASNEYFKAVKAQNIDGELITPVFKDYKSGQYKVISFFAKKARGAMARYIIQNRIMEPESLKKFDWQGYRYDDHLSTQRELVFCRNQEQA
ncbi:MAG: peroxide stress protein YaaA [Pseudomonadales bacterium]|nr:peroxide stress protein YaaA [Pseudomonadales bacterium]